MPTGDLLTVEVIEAFQEAPHGVLETLPGYNLPVTPAPPEIQASAPLLPVSGFRYGVREIGRSAGWVTWPLWRPIVEIVRDTGRMVDHLRTPVRHIQGWKAKAQTDLDLWATWTPAQRASVVRQQAVWMVSLLVCSVLFMSVPLLGFIPLFLLSLAWWGRSHNLHWHDRTLVRHWDVVRWGLGLPQVPEAVE